MGREEGGRRFGHVVVVECEGVGGAVGRGGAQHTLRVRAGWAVINDATTSHVTPFATHTCTHIHTHTHAQTDRQIGRQIDR